MKHLYIVRHGNTFDKGDTVLRVGGRTDLDLSTSGQLQAGALAMHFAEFETQPVRVIAGPLKRTLQTAQAIADALGVLHVQVDERLREVDYGPDEGKPEDQVIARIGEDALAAWESEARVPDGWQVDPAALVQAWKDLLIETHHGEGDMIAVTSNGVARFALAAAGAAGKAPLKLRTGAYGVIAVREFDLELVAWDVRP
ncbi:MAG: histidine phosphatase family protein [Hyphomonadaceae bacterium]|nr:histidine phosphatase family protein [Hyphomonadaceae bacterium]